MTKKHGSALTALLGWLLFVPPRRQPPRRAWSATAMSCRRRHVQELFRRDKNYATLDRLSPDGDHFLVPKFQELTDLKTMSQRTLRLAMLELVPAVNREWRLATYGNEGLSLFSLKERRSYPIKIPAGAFVSDMRWSPDGTQLAFRRASADGLAGVGCRREDRRRQGRERRAGDGDARGAPGWRR